MKTIEETVEEFNKIFKGCDQCDYAASAYGSDMYIEKWLEQALKEQRQVGRDEGFMNGYEAGVDWQIYWDDLTEEEKEKARKTKGV